MGKSFVTTGINRMATLQLVGLATQHVKVHRPYMRYKRWASGKNEHEKPSGSKENTGIRKSLDPNPKLR